MEMKYVVPDMAQSFGTLEFAGESEPIFERDKNNRKVIARRSYNLYSDIQKGENVVVEIPVQAGEKHFKYEQKVKLVNPKLYGRGYAIGDMGHTDYVLVADDIVMELQKYKDMKFYTCHCTGKTAFDYLSHHMNNIYYISCGETVEI